MRVAPTPARMAPIARAKWQLFRLLERFSDLRGNQTDGRLNFDIPPAPTAALWVFVSTIGELHAIDPFLRQLANRFKHLKLVLITDHAHYRETYQRHCPAATVCVSRGHGEDAKTLARHFPPRALVVAEIPCLPFDAPCRFSFGFVLAAKQHRAPVVLVNGWLYHYQPACRMDAIERRLFLRDYLRAFDVLCVQDEMSRQSLIRFGARPERVTVAGNIKFDSMHHHEWRASDARSPRLLSGLLDSRRAIIVAGCVNDPNEQRFVLDAFRDVLRQDPNALLVLAPRHPEVGERMKLLRELLDEMGLVARFRTSIADATLGDEVNCLVLDTIGDLRDFYAAASIAHVGVDHNVLEPLGFGKPVTVVPGWETTFPSYPVYRMLSDAGALLEARSSAALGAHWWRVIASPSEAGLSFAPAEVALDAARGAVARHFDAIESVLPGVVLPGASLR